MGVQTAQGSRILVTTLREYGDCKQADEEVWLWQVFLLNESTCNLWAHSIHEYSGKATNSFLRQSLWFELHRYFEI
jgi:hypothetical protein